MEVGVKHKLPNVRKSDIPSSEIAELVPSNFSRVVQRIRCVRFNFWAGKIEVNDTTTTIEPMERANDGR
jgi:hypothetical protein